MQSLIAQFQGIVVLMRANLPLVLLLILGLWAIHLLNYLLKYRLNFLGLYPRSWHGLIGIFTAPLLHADFNHLFFNSIPLLVFVSFILISGVTTLISVTLIIAIIGGIGTWLFGRKGLHIGASILIMGYLGYLLVNAYYAPTAMGIIISLVCIYYFGGLLSGLLPGKASMSWEGHLFGFIGGIAAAFIPLTTF